VNVVLALAPDFALILFGWVLSRWFAATVWQGIDRLSYYVLYPALIFHAAAARPVAPGDALLLGLAAAGVLSAGLALGLLTRRLRTDTPVNVGARLQNAYRFNTALGFVAIGVLPASAASVLAILVGCAIPLANVFAVIGLTRGQRMSRARLAGEVLTNPFLLASLAGLIVALSRGGLPGPVDAFSARLAQAALPLVLLSIGAALAGARLWPLDRQAVALHAIRLLALPAIVWATAAVFALQGVAVATVLLFAALPTASAAHVLAARYGADRAAVAVLVTQSSLLGLLSLPLWAIVAVGLVG